LQHLEYGARGTIGSQHTGFGNRAGEWQGFCHYLSGLSRPQERATEQVIKRPEQWAESLSYLTLGRTAALCQGAQPIVTIVCPWLGFRMPHKKQFHRPSVYTTP
jgi:hypothetical protein